MSTEAPPVHPLTWDELRVYEKQQGGYWLYGTDPFGADKQWVQVLQPEDSAERWPYVA